MTDPQLMSFLNFDESELQANRNGRLSEKQKARLATQEKGAKGCNGILGGFLILVGLVGIAIAVSAGTALASDELGAAIAIAAAFGCLWPLIWGGIGFFQVRRAFAKVKVEVKKAEGPINIVKTIRREYNSSTQMHTEHTVYELRVGGRTFEVRSGLPNYMMQGDVYAVYFAEFNLKDKEKEILSAELLTGRSAEIARESAPSDDVEVVEYLKKGDVMGAIRAHRSIHESSFDDARGAVDEMKSRLGY